MSAARGEITVKEILAPMGGTLLSGNPQSVFSGICTDSRKMRSDNLFWALSGDRYDGHDFATKAMEQGAMGVVVRINRWKKEDANGNLNSRFGDRAVIAVDDTLKALGDLAGWWRRRHNARLVAVTGSVGKTTTKEMVAEILQLSGKTLKNPGNFNNLIGLPLTLLRLDKGHESAVLEMGMNRRGEIARLTEIADPDVGVITNVGRAHLEGLGDLDRVARAKTELVERISPGKDVVLNGDDELLMKTASTFQDRKKVITFGLDKRNDVRGSMIRGVDRKGISFDLQYQGDSWEVNLKVPGVHNVLNALAAAAAGMCLDTSHGHIVEGLGRFAGLEGRFRVSSLPGDIILVDDTYNANPSSLEAGLESVKAMVRESDRVIVGLGQMLELGEATISAHREAGSKVAELGARYFIAMGDHAHEMIKGALKAGMPGNRTEVATTHGEMVRAIKNELREGDLVFLKGSRKIGLEKVVSGLKGAS